MTDAPVIPVGVDLAGRHDEIAALASRLDRARAGRGGHVVIRGGVGTGKSAFLNALCHFGDEHFTVIRAYCRPEQPDFTLADHVVAMACESLHEQSPAVRTRPGNENTSYPRLRALTAPLVRLAAAAPVLLLVDDVQWCDEASLAWLNFLARRVASLPVLVVVAHTADFSTDATELLSEAASTPDRTILPLGALDENAVAEILHREFGEPPSAAFTRLCLTLSGGVPAMLLRLCAALRSVGIYPDDQHLDRAKAVGTTALAPVLLPCLFGTAPMTIAVLRAVAALNRTDIELVVPLSNAPARDAALVVEELDRRLAPGPGREIVLATALVGLSTGDRERLRAEAARLLTEAGLPAVAVDHCPDLGVDGPSGPDDEPPIADVAQVFSTATDPHLLAGAVHRFATQPMAPVWGPVAVELAAETLGRMPADADPETRTRLESALLLLRSQANKYVSRYATGTWNGPASTRRVSAARALAATLCGDDAERSAGLAREALGAGVPGLGEYWYWSSAYVLHMADDTGGALEAITAVVDGDHDEDLSWSRCQSLSLRAMFALDAGLLDAALADARGAVDIVERRGWQSRGALAQVTLAACLLSRGDIDRAQVVLGQIDRAELGGNALYELKYLVTAARARWLVGDHDRAIELLLECGRRQQAAHIDNPVHTPWWLDLVCLLADLGREREATEHVEWAEERARSWGTARALGAAALARGLLLGGRAGTESITGAVELLSRSQARACYWRTKKLLETHLARVGDSTAAHRHLTRPTELAANNVSHLIVPELREKVALGSGGGRVVLSEPPGPVLSESERRVAGLVAEGHTNREIAARLCVTVRTVEAHLTSVYRKLRVSGRRDLWRRRA